MCLDSDLFDDVIVTLDDVEFWLDVVPKNLSASCLRRAIYAKNYDVANKIKAAKRSGLFYSLQDANLQQTEKSLIGDIYSNKPLPNFASNGRMASHPALIY